MVITILVCNKNPKMAYFYKKYKITQIDSP